MDVTKRVKEQRRKCALTINEEGKTVLFGLIDKHYFRSTVAFDVAYESLRDTALAELQD